MAASYVSSHLTLTGYRFGLGAINLYIAPLFFFLPGVKKRCSSQLLVYFATTNPAAVKQESDPVLFKRFQ